MTNPKPAAPETETDAREPFLIASLRRNPSGDIRHSPVGDGALGTSARGFLAEFDAYVAERVRVVEGERDLYLHHIDLGTEQLTEAAARAESAEAAHAAEKAAHDRLRAGVRETADLIDEGVVSGLGGDRSITLANISTRLRALLGGGGAR